MSSIDIDDDYSQQYSEKEPAPQYAQKYRWIQLLALVVLAAGLFMMHPESTLFSLLPAMYGVMILIFLSVCIFCFPDSYKSKKIGLFLFLDIIQIGLTIYSLMLTLNIYEVNLDMIYFFVTLGGVALLFVVIIGLIVESRRN